MPPLELLIGGVLLHQNILYSPQFHNHPPSHSKVKPIHIIETIYQGRSHAFDRGGGLKIWKYLVYIFFSNFNRWSNTILYREIQTRQVDILIIFLIISLISKALAIHAKSRRTLLQCGGGGGEPPLGFALAIYLRDFHNYHIHTCQNHYLLSL